jgi:predicted metal-dependent hydrolase
MLKKYNKRTHIQMHGDDFVMLFGEQVPKSELPAIKSMKKFLQATLEEYAIPLLDKYSKLIGENYIKLTTRVTHSKW